MTYVANPRHYTRDEFRTLIDGLSWVKGWRPAFPTLHNTGVPSLAQWEGYGATAQERWGASLNRYYQGLGWHAGPHLVCCPEYIWNLCDLEQNGVSVSCWNSLTIGIEMVGDFRHGGDDPSSGDGAKVLDNAVWALAVLAHKLGWAIGDVEAGVKGLHFHRECAHDAHACPGDLVNKSDVIGRVVRAMTALGATSAPAAVAVAPTAAPSAPPGLNEEAWTRWVQGFLSARGAKLDVDGDLGPDSRDAISSYLIKHAG